MEQLWNMLISHIITALPLPSKGFEPGSMEYSNIFPSVNFNTITSKFKTTSLRDVVLESVQPLNDAYFFVILQIALCVYCPSLALSIIYQSYDLEVDEEEQLDQNMQLNHQFQTQYEKQQFVQQTSSFSLSSFIQTLLQNVYQSQTQMQQIEQMQQQQQQQQLAMQIFVKQQLTQQLKQKAIQLSTQKNGDGKVKILITIQIPNVEGTATAATTTTGLQPGAGQVHVRKVTWQKIKIIF